MPRAPGQEKTAARTAWLPQFFDYTCDPGRVRTAYRCRAYPDEQQQAVLNRTFGCVRVVWNRTLAARHARWHTDRKGTSYAETDRALTAMKQGPGLAFLSGVPSVPLQQALRHQHKAFTAFFAKRARYPRFKSRRGRQSAHYTRSAFSLRGGELRLAKTDAMLRFIWSWPEVDVTALNPAMVIVSREPDGRWYVTFTIEASDPEPLPETGRAVGIDLGVTDFAVTSGGDKIANPRPLERKARRLARYQRRLARCRKGSANRAKAAAAVARAHRKVRHARADFLHRASTRLVRTAGTHHHRRPQRPRHGPQPASGPRHRGLRVGRVPPPAGVQVPAVRPPPGRHRPLVSLVQDLLGVRAPARRAEPLHPALDVPVLRHPARPGHQRRQEHPCGRSCRSPGLPERCLRS